MYQISALGIPGGKMNLINQLVVFLLFFLQIQRNFNVIQHNLLTYLAFVLFDTDLANVAFDILILKRVKKGAN